ncbi:MAG: proline--tRNA ligase [Alphaproteobacteria bacterium]|nr:proline--tRNA ligase [Alphaproteobacteria bacterium]
MTPPKQGKNAIAPTRRENFSEWYQEVIGAASMAENAPVRGCMVIKPYGYAVWENVQKVLGQMIKDNDVQNAYFPLLIPLSYISKEAEHIEGFAKECAVVTHHRLEKGPDGNLVPAGLLAEPFVIRPTSETIIGEVLSNWIKSYRDLPIKLNQWCNVMRWEMRPRVFLRTSEFLWQEGHNCFASAEEARRDALDMLDMYVDFLQNYMAIPGIKGEKTEDERFPGAMATYTYEAMMQDGKALQMCTSHNLGQTFSKGANIQYLGKDGIRQYAHTTSWGLSTRTIGALVMVHGDDDGMVMPPKIAPYHVCIIPIFRGDDSESKILEQANKIKRSLAAIGVTCYIDIADDKPQNKIWSSIRRGVPIRIELGPKEAENNQITFSRRDQDRQLKTSCAVEEFIGIAKSVIDDMQRNIYQAAEKRLAGNVVEVYTPEEADAFFASGRVGFISMATDMLKNPDFQRVRAKYPITPRCMPLKQNGKTVIMGLSY